MVESDRRIGFPPRLTDQAHSLILGSVPGARSLKESEYYAHPRNAFWPVMGLILGFDPKSDYQTRVCELNAAGYALWDVLLSCHRPGSLDSNIQTESMLMNDFQALFLHHPTITRVFFNGGTAEKLFKQHVWPDLKGTQPDLIMQGLPSTSPANAAMTLAEKTQIWQSAMLNLKQT